jgi:hypothetical protein
MARWSRSRLRIFGIGAVALLGGSLLIIPAVSQAEDKPAPARPARAVAPAAADRIATVAGKNGRSAFEFQPASGDRRTPFAFVSSGGTVRAQRISGAHRPAVQAKTGAPQRATAATTAATSYPTTLTIDSDNWSAFGKIMNLWNRDTWTLVPVTNPQDSRSATATLPPGNYYVAAIYGIYQVNSYLLTKAFTVTDRAQTVHLDQKSAKETGIRIDDSTAQQDMNAVWMSLPNGDLVGFAGGPPQTRTYVTTASVAGTTLRVHEVLTKAGSTPFKPSPYRYDLMQSWPHPLPASPFATVKTASLAKTTTTIRAQGVNADAQYMTVPTLGEWTGVYLATPVRVPATVTEYVTPDVTMSRLVSYGDGQSLQMRDRTLAAGTSAGETVGAGPLAPGRRLLGGTFYDDSRRVGNQLQILENMTLGDAAGNSGADGAATSITLSSGGQVLKTSNTVSLVADVPSTQQTYQLQQTTTRKVGWSQLSTRIRSEWTFASASAASSLLPLMDLAMAASGLDQRNRAGSAPVRLTVTPSTRRIAAKNTVDEVEWSVDDGTTWTDLPLLGTDGGAEVSLAVPVTAAFVSLRVTASNDQGGALRRTVLRALAGPAVPGDQSVGATTISNVEVNGGNPLVMGTSGTAEITASFTATDPSGIASGGMYLWHGAYARPDGAATTPAGCTPAQRPGAGSSPHAVGGDAATCTGRPVGATYNTPDGMLTARTSCTPVDATTSTCTASFYLYDMRYALASNVLAGTWRAEAWASANDGTGFTDRRGAGSLAVKRATTLTADATPEPVNKGKMITVTGALTRGDWESGGYQPFPWQTVALQWAKANTSTWTTVKTLETDANGKLKATVTAGSDGSYRFSFAGDAGSDLQISGADAVDVQ